MAGFDPYLTEVEVQIWRNEGHAKALWIEIAKRLSQAAAAVLAFLFVFAPEHAHAAALLAEQIAHRVTSGLDTLYIMENYVYSL